MADGWGGICQSGDAAVAGGYVVFTLGRLRRCGVDIGMLSGCLVCTLIHVQKARILLQGGMGSVLGEVLGSQGELGE